MRCNFTSSSNESSEKYRGRIRLFQRAARSTRSKISGSAFFVPLDLQVFLSGGKANVVVVEPHVGRVHKSRSPLKRTRTSWRSAQSNRSTGTGGTLKWTPFFRPGVKVVKQACSIKKGAEKSEEKSYEAQPCPQISRRKLHWRYYASRRQWRNYPAGTRFTRTRSTNGSGSFWRTSRVLSRPKRWAEAMPRCARPNCFRKSGS